MRGVPAKDAVFRRDVARIDDPPFSEGHAPGHRVRALIDGADPTFSDPFLVLAEDYMPSGAYPLHPHRGFETVTFVIEGSIRHRDTVGNAGVIQAGDAQWLTAGRGLQHEESAPEGTFARALQLWVNLPGSSKLIEPRYQELLAVKMPARQEQGVEVRVFSGQSGEIVSSTVNHVPVTMLDVKIAPGASFTQSLHGNENTFVYVIDGESVIGAAETIVNSGAGAWLTRSRTHLWSEITVAASAQDARLLILSGQPLCEPVVSWGPFVMNTEAEIAQARADYNAGRF